MNKTYNNLDILWGDGIIGLTGTSILITSPSMRRRSKPIRLDSQANNSPSISGSTMRIFQSMPDQPRERGVFLGYFDPTKQTLAEWVSEVKAKVAAVDLGEDPFQPRQDQKAPSQIGRAHV